jgi:hypothetical protein
LHFSGYAALRIGTQSHSGISCFVTFNGTIMQELITDAERSQLLANGRAREMRHAADPLPVVRLFTPDAHATWLLTELDPEDGDTAYGLCDLGIGLPALGTVRLSEMASIRGPQNLRIQRDLYFVATRTLSEYTRLAQHHGSIID